MVGNGESIPLGPERKRYNSSNAVSCGAEKHWFLKRGKK